MVSEDREAALRHTLETYEFLLRKRDDMVITQRYVIGSLLVLVIALMSVLATQC